VWVERHKYYPYGEENPATVSNREKYATYQRDQSTNLDYAMNRYYGWQHGRFLTPDPYKGSSRRRKPLSWNRYVYAQNDPVNFRDPRGLFREDVDYEEADDYDSFFDFWDIPGDDDPGERTERGMGDRPAQEDGGSPALRPECDRRNPLNAKVLAFVERNREAARSLERSFGLRADFILAWAAFESGYGTGAAARLDNNNFFGLTAPSANSTGGWAGAIPCSTKTGATFPGFACFPTDEMNDMYGGNNLYYSGFAALESQGNRYLRPALAAQNQGGSLADVANAIALAGFNTEPVDYGGRVAGAAEAIARRKGCP